MGRSDTVDKRLRDESTDVEPLGPQSQVLPPVEIKDPNVPVVGKNKVNLFFNTIFFTIQSVDGVIELRVGFQLQGQKRGRIQLEIFESCSRES